MAIMNLLLKPGAVKALTEARALLEKVTPPYGSDASPYYIRDLGTIFFIQAAAEYLLRENVEKA